MKIVVYELTGEYATTAEEGCKVRDRVSILLHAGEQVELDFHEVSVFTVAFWNYAIASLLKDFSPDTLNQSLSITGLSAYNVWVLRMATDNAKEFYKVGPCHRR